VDGFKQTYKQIQSFGLSTQFMGDDFANRNKFQRWDANGQFTIDHPLKNNTQFLNENTPTATTFGTVAAGSSKWFGGVLAPNNFIYGCPMNATTILKINTEDDTVTTFGSVAAGSNKWLGSTLVGYIIYCTPFASTSILKIDTRTDTTTTFGNVTGSNKYVGSVLAPNGCLYHIPYDATTIMKVDTLTDSISFFGNISGSSKYVGGVLCGDFIYCIPYASSTILVINWKQDDYFTFGNLIGGATKYQGGTLVNNRFIYALPHFNNSFCLKIDCKTNTISQTITVLSNLYSGCVVGVDGNIYALPYQSTSTAAVKINIRDDSVTTFGSFSNTILKYRGNVLAPNGKIYGIPEATTSCAYIKIGEYVETYRDPNFALNRHFNKF